MDTALSEDNAAILLKLLEQRERQIDIGDPITKVDLGEQVRSVVVNHPDYERFTQYNELLDTRDPVAIEFPVAHWIEGSFSIDSDGAELPREGQLFLDNRPKDLEILPDGKFRSPALDMGKSRGTLVFHGFVAVPVEWEPRGGAVDVGTSARGKRKVAWIDVVGELYRAALSSDHNELMIAWARGHAKRLKR